MESRIMNNGYEGLRARLLAANDQGRGVKFSVIGSDTGIGRSKISQYAHGHANLKEAELAAITEYLDGMENPGAQDGERPVPSQIHMLYKSEIELYQTAEHRKAIGWCTYILNKRKAGAMVGYPGSGKTTVLREFCKIAPGARYIDCWPTMIIGDLIKAIASALGLTVTGTKHDRIMRIVNHLQGRDDVMLIFDEAENLRNWNVKSIEVIRKIWDNTRTPVIFAGTQELENMLTRGGGRENLAQLYRRKYEFRMTGITAEEVNMILHDYNITPDAANILLGIALDVKHGGIARATFCMRWTSTKSPRACSWRTNKSEPAACFRAAGFCIIISDIYFAPPLSNNSRRYIYITIIT